MKIHISLSIVLLAFVLTFISCQKEEVINKEPKVTEKSVEVGSTTATFTWTVDWLGKFASVVEVSENEDMSNSQTFGSETETGNKNFTTTATGFKEVTCYYYRFLVWNKNYVDKKFKTEVKSFTTKSDVPKVKTTEVTDVTRTTAIVICEVTDESGALVTEKGVCWGTAQNPTTEGSHLSNGIGMGTYSVALSGLETGKTYYVRAYAKNGNGTAYGDELNFTTGDAVKPTVSTAVITDIDWRTATGVGEVTDDGDAPVTERGICWSTNHDPEITDSHASSGNGTGSYNVDLSGLTAGTTYYVRAYAKNQAGIGYGNEVSFSSKAPELPTVTTLSVNSITHQSAQGKGEVVSDGGLVVTERGICWSASHNPDINGSHASSGTGTGSFTCSITNLDPETQYYVRAYARNSVGISYGGEVSFTTFHEGLASVTTISVSDVGSATAKCEGNVTYDGNYTVTDRGVCWSTSHDPDISGNHISSGNDIGLFTCTITGLEPETRYFVRAYATNSVGTNYGSELTFTTGPLPVGTIKGLFSVSSSEQVYFSQGNLQYQASTDTWRFAEHQYDIIGDNNSNISSNNSGWIDLFGWGTSGYNNKYPYKTNQIGDDYGNGNNDIAGTHYDWGVHNAISNGGGQAGLWRTLLKDEWVYVFNTRSTVSGIRYAMACVNGKNGVILLPDDWNETCYILSSTNNASADFASNIISASQWVTLEQHGAIFLPVAGLRGGTSVYNVVTHGVYWSASYSNNYYACDITFSASYGLNLLGSHIRSSGFSVRLVRAAQ